MNINTVKLLVEFIVNKQQGGIVTPDRFNLAAQSAVTEWFNICYGQPILSKNGQQSNDMVFQSTQKISDNLKPFIKPIILQINTQGKANYPSDYVHVSSVRYNYDTQQVPVIQVNDDDIGEYLSSQIFTPDKRYPVFCMYAANLQFYPIDLARVQFTYLRRPAVPIWGFTVSPSGRPVYDPATSVDIEYPDENLNEIVMRICMQIGVSINEQGVIGYTAQMENKGS